MAKSRQKASSDRDAPLVSGGRLPGGGRLEGVRRRKRARRRFESAVVMQKLRLIKIKGRGGR